MKIERILDRLEKDIASATQEDIQSLIAYIRKLQKRIEKIIAISDRQQEEINKKRELLEDISKKLSLYLSPQIYEAIFAGKKDVALTSQRKKLTIFFSDLINFTQATEQFEPEVISEILNEYISNMFDIALKHGATIDKFIGDAVMVFFGDPESFGEKEDALRCVAMAIEMKKRIEELEPKWMARGLLEPFKARMGIASGYATVGNFGSMQRMDYTAIGKSVNLASRIQSAAGANEILISHETYSYVKDRVFCEKKNAIYVKGIPYPIPIYKVIDFYDNIKSTKEISCFMDGFTLYVDSESVDKKQVIARLRRVIEELSDD